jgi:hypothetical protein
MDAKTAALAVNHLMRGGINDPDWIVKVSAAADAFVTAAGLPEDTSWGDAVVTAMHLAEEV